MASVRALKAEDIREYQRENVSMPATLRIPDILEMPVTVQNLSSGGFMAETDAVFEPGAAFMIALEGIGELHARVVWSAKGAIGCKFPMPLDRCFPKGKKKAY